MEILGSGPSQVPAITSPLYLRVMGLRDTTHIANTDINHNVDLP